MELKENLWLNLDAEISRWENNDQTSLHYFLHNNINSETILTENKLHLVEYGDKKIKPIVHLFHLKDETIFFYGRPVLDICSCSRDFEFLEKLSRDFLRR